MDNTDAAYDSKADFSDIYDRDDPRTYYRTLAPLDYRIPDHGQSVFRPLVEMVTAERGGSATVLDVCCSYGVNAALLNHDVSMDDLYARYTSTDVEGADRDGLVESDRRWFADRRRTSTADVIGLDVAGRAVAYAVDAGLLTAGIVADLEAEEPTDRSAELLAGVDVVTVTGGIGYVREKTFAHIMGAAHRPPWVAALSLRWIDFTPIAEQLSSTGLTVERLEGQLVAQRRFHDEQERDATLEALEHMSIDPRPEHAANSHLAELYLARPPAIADTTPIEVFRQWLDDAHGPAA